LESSKEQILSQLLDMKFVIPKGQVGIALEYFLENPNVDVQHDRVVPWINGMYQMRFNRACKDPGRGIRRLHEMGLLIKVEKGVYRFEPENIVNNDLYDFDEPTKNAVKIRDGFRCVVCKKGIAEGVEIQVDHIKPRSKGGDGSIDNGQTLCGSHNYRKNKMDQISMGADMFKRLQSLASKAPKDDLEAQKILSFCSRVLDTYAEFGYD
jgi:hypothetical protein